MKEKRCNLGPLVTPEERFVRYQAEQKRNVKNEEEEGNKRQSWREKNADVPYSEPSLIRHPLHHPPDPPQSLKKQNNVLTWRWRGAEGRAAREGGKLGNQM